MRAIKKEIKKALAPVRMRLRHVRALRAAAWGLCGGGLVCLALMGLSFLTPIRGRILACGILLAAGAALPGLCALALPVGQDRAAKAGDGCGLLERVQTALTLPETDSPMAQLQLQDTLAALENVDVKRIPGPKVKKPLLLAGAAAVLSAALLLIPNPQNAVIERAQAFEDLTKKAVEQAETAIEASDLTEAQKREARKLTEELKRELLKARNPMDAMLALGGAEERLEALRNDLAGEKQDALSQALSGQGLDALAEAVNQGDQAAMEQALEGMEGESLSAAASQLSGDMQSALNAAAQALQNGDLATALENLSGLSQAMRQMTAAQLASLSQLLSSLRSGMGQGDQQGQSGRPGVSGQDGEGSQSGAGRGSTNMDMTQKDVEDTPGGRGSEDPRYKEGGYSQVYDPTRLDADETPLSAQSPQGEGEAVQVNLGPGAGSLGGVIPDRQMVLEYAGAAAQAADSQNLTNQERQWVADYFAALVQ